MANAFVATASATTLFYDLGKHACKEVVTIVRYFAICLLPLNKFGCFYLLPLNKFMHFCLTVLKKWHTFAVINMVKSDAKTAYLAPITLCFFCISGMFVMHKPMVKWWQIGGKWVAIKKHLPPRETSINRSFQWVWWQSGNKKGKTVITMIRKEMIVSSAILVGCGLWGLLLKEERSGRK